MNATSLVRLAAVSLIVLTAAVGCKKRPERVTPIPGLRAGTIGDQSLQPLGPGDQVSSTDPSGVIPLSEDLKMWQASAEQPFRSDTIYFDFDKSVVKADEMSKIERVAAAMRNYPGKALRIEGHCDERGTEEYNRSLGEKRALAVREKLNMSGVSAQRVDTITYGEDRPSDPGHDSAAWSKNRRAEFILIEPPTAASATTSTTP